MKQEKILKVVMTPTQNPTKLHVETMGELVYSNQIPKEYKNDCPFQHLYFVSDERPEKGDWCYDPTFGVGKIIMECGEECFYSKHKSGGSVTIPWKRNLGDRLKKIEATTDPKLIKDGVPQIPEDFIKLYAERNGVDEVVVECEIKLKCEDCECISKAEEANGGYPVKDSPCLGFYTYELKTNPDGTAKWQLKESGDEFNTLREKWLKLLNEPFQIQPFQIQPLQTTYTEEDMRNAFQAGARRGCCQRSLMTNVGATCNEPDEDEWMETYKKRK